jgi:hypothetical protein
VAAATISSAGTSAKAATATPTTTTTIAAAPCPPGVPFLCTAPSNATALNAAQAAKQWPVRASTYLTEAQAIGEVTRFWGGTAHAMFTRYANASNLMGDPGANPNINPNTRVWLITITAATGSGGFSQGSSLGGTATIAPSRFFSIVMDAANGLQIDECYGCDTVTSD